jgi:hypothetical protein
VRLRAPVDDQGEPLAPFERPAAVWRELGAPLELVDVEAAAAAELAEHGPLIGREFGGGPVEFYAGRYWRRHRPRFLAARGQLTPAEARIVAARATLRQGRR